MARSAGQSQVSGCQPLDTSSSLGTSVSSQGWPQMGHLEEGDRDPCTPAHNRCVGIGKTPFFPGVGNTDSGAKNPADTPAPAGGQSSEFHLLRIKPCFPSGRGSTKEFRVTPHPQEPSGPPGRAQTPGPLLSSYPQVPALPGWLPLFPHCPKCHRSSFCPMPEIQPSLTQSLPAWPGPQPISFTDAHPWAHHRAQSLAPSFLTLPAPQSFEVSQV